MVFSLREDYLAHLDEARAFLPDVLGNSFRLAALDRFNARMAVTEPAARAGVQVEPALVDALVGKAGETGAGDLVEETSGLVPPPALQIVLDRLYRGGAAARPRRERSAAARPDADPGGLPGHPPRAGAGQGSEQARSCTGAAAILAGYVDEGLARLPGLTHEDGTPVGGRRRAGRGDPQGDGDQPEDQGRADARRDRGRLDEAGAIDKTNWRDRRGRDHPAGAGAGAPAARLRARRRTAYYELTHDHLAGEIAARHLGRRRCEASWRVSCCAGAWTIGAAAPGCCSGPRSWR